jgi:pilus assembly protein Flp/PilA
MGTKGHDVRSRRAAGLVVPDHSPLPTCGPPRGLRHLMRADRGATAAEYALMVALIALVIIATVMIVGERVNDLFAIPPGYL